MYFGKIIRALYPYWRKRLTVLSYHRICSPSELPMGHYRTTVSSTPERFNRQMELVSRHFNTVTVANLSSWLLGDTSLPDRPLLITFDDGYRDNFENALPILVRHGLTAQFFLASDYIRDQRPFLWDTAAYCFTHTVLQSARLPLVGTSRWKNDTEKYILMHHWIRLARLQYADIQQQAVSELCESLQVRIPAEVFSHLLMNWDQVRELVACGMSVGSHTKSHTVLDRVNENEAVKELRESRIDIERETGRKVNSLAYPVGAFNLHTEKFAKETGYDVAFGTHPGPTRLTSVASHPFSIRRVEINRKDDIVRFTAKLAGLSRFKSRYLQREHRHN